MSTNVRKLEVLSILTEIKQEIRQKFDEVFSGKSGLKVQKKADESIVTDIDLFISDIFKKKFLQKYDFLNFFSEEDQDRLDFPVIILDPIDGTKELARGINECAVSFGVYFSEDLNDSRNFSWIYNPFNEFEIFSCEEVLYLKRSVEENLIAYVSRTEYEADMHRNNDQINFYPKGSIAFKLALLASGAGDFVITKKPKNIWDIMAGTHICFNRGIGLYQNGSKLTKLTQMTIENNLVWASSEVWEKIKNQL